MNNKQIKILIVEDEYSIALDIQSTVESFGYTVCDWAPTYEEAITKIVEHQPHLILMDINLNKEKNGIDVAKQVYQKFNIPFIFITAFSDKKTLDEALATYPMGYLVKPFKDEELLANIKIVLSKNNAEKNTDNQIIGHINNNEDTIFLKNKSTLEKYYYKDIYYLKALDNYTIVYTSDKKVTINTFLKDFYAELPKHMFVRVHRSYIVGLHAIKLIEENTIYLNDQTSIPIGKKYKSELMDAIKIHQ